MAKLVQIGTSYGVRIPKFLIKKLKLQNCDIDLNLHKNGILLIPIKNHRSNWDTPHLRQKAKQETNPQDLYEDIGG